MRIVWTEASEIDQDDLYDYIAKDSPIYAEQFEAINKLALVHVRRDLQSDENTPWD